MLCKTTSDKLEAVTRVVCREHPYDEPEVVGLNVSAHSLHHNQPHLSRERNTKRSSKADRLTD